MDPWTSAFMSKVMSDAAYVQRLRTDPVNAVHEIPGVVPAELEAELLAGAMLDLPASNDDGCEAIRLWLERLIELLSLSRWHFMLK